jgi:hypothetical protein
VVAVCKYTAVALMATASGIDLGTQPGSVVCGVMVVSTAISEASCGATALRASDTGVRGKIDTGCRGRQE